MYDRMRSVVSSCCKSEKLLVNMNLRRQQMVVGSYLPRSKLHKVMHVFGWKLTREYQHCSFLCTATFLSTAAEKINVFVADTSVIKRV